MADVVLSLFPGIGMLDMAFEEDDFCVVRGPDCLWGGDIRRFHPPAGKFNGVIGGPPCQCFSSLAHMVRHNGYEPKFGNLIPEFERCVAEAQPQWFLMEEVPAAPVPCVEGYGVHTFILNNRQLGEAQNRTRRISFGLRGGRRVLMIDIVALESREFRYAATGAGRCEIPGAIGERNKVGRLRERDILSRGTQRSQKGFSAVKELQGLPLEFDIPPFTVQAKVAAIANGVPLAMGRALAKAVKEALNENCEGGQR